MLTKLIVKASCLEGEREIDKQSIFDCGYFRSAENLVVFPTAWLDNTNIMSYIIRMYYLHGNIKWVSTLFFKMRDQKFSIFVWSAKKGDISDWIFLQKWVTAFSP